MDAITLLKKDHDAVRKMQQRRSVELKSTT